MKKRTFAALLATALLASSCGYHVSGMVNPKLAGAKSFSVSMFRNLTLHPEVGMMVTSAVTDRLEKSGTMQLESPAKADCSISGSISRVTRDSLRANPQDSALSSEIDLTVHLEYKVTDNRTGRELMAGTATGTASFFNNDLGSIRTAEQNALSYAARQAADDLVTELTLP